VRVVREVRVVRAGSWTDRVAGAEAVSVGRVATGEASMAVMRAP
jgi:hypothetical protein